MYLLRKLSDQLPCWVRYFSGNIFVFILMIRFGPELHVYYCMYIIILHKVKIKRIRKILKNSNIGLPFLFSNFIWDFATSHISLDESYWVCHFYYLEKARGETLQCNTFHIKIFPPHYVNRNLLRKIIHSRLHLLFSRSREVQGYCHTSSI